MGNVKEFNAELAAWTEKVVMPAAAKMQRDVIRDTAYGFVDGNPVGDPTTWVSQRPKPGYKGGHSKRNWRVYLYRSYEGGEKNGVDPSGILVKSEIDSVIARIADKPVDFVTISNPVEYMDRLANGWSKQAPAGWIEAVVASVTQKYARVR